MKRKEEINIAAKNKYPYIKGLPQSYSHQAIFIEGAEWADKTMLDRACEWVKENIDLYSYNAFNTKSSYTEITLTDEFETAFRQAMKGE